MRAKSWIAVALAAVCCAFLLIGLLVGPGSERTLRVSLDFFPNPNHVPLYVAIEDGLFSAHGLDVELMVPANPSDPVKLAAVRTVDVALTPQINYLIARSEDLPLVSIGALVDQNLGGLLALGERGIEEISDLEGRRIGYSLAPLEPILWETMLDCSGVSMDDVELINVGYATVASLLAGSVDAIGAFRTFEPIQVEMQGGTPVFFPQEAYCVPPTYDLVLVTQPELIDDRAEDLRAFLAALAEAVELTIQAPEEAYALFVRANPDLDDRLNRRSFEATLPVYAAGLRHDEPKVWQAVQAFLYEHGLVADELPLDALYSTDLLPRD